MTVPLLRYENARIAFRRHGRSIDAVRDVTLEVERGEALALVGESGSGKSTLAMAALGWIAGNGRLVSGRIFFEGRDLSRLDARALRALRGRRIAAVYQNPSTALNPVLTIGRQLSEVLACHRGLEGTAAGAAVEELLDQVRLADPAATLKRYPHEISGGMQQRVVIAMALAGEPDLLVLDEPTTALDAGVRLEVLDLVRRLRSARGLSLLLVSHDLEIVRGLVDRVAVLRAGRLVEVGDAATVMSRPAHAYTRALLGCVPRAGMTKADGPLMTLDRDGAGATPRQELPAPPSPERGPAHVALGRASPDPALLTVEHLSRTFGRRQILDGIDLDVRGGETLGIVGESGSGKSTLARVIAGLVAPGTGHVRLHGQGLAERAARRPRSQLRAIQMVFQSPDSTLNPSHRIGRIVAIAIRRLTPWRGRAADAQASSLLASVRLPRDLANALPAHLSGGQRQRVAIARALAGEPELLILDEPTSALDVSVQATIINLLVELQARARNLAYLFISHDLALVRYLADRIAVMQGGRLVEIGPADRVFSAPAHPYTRTLLQAGGHAPVGNPIELASPADTAAVDGWRELGDDHRVRV